MYSKVPATSYTQVIFCRHNMDQSCILGSYFLKQLSRSVCRMIIHNDYIEREITFLRQGTLHCILYSPDTVIYRNYDRSCDWKSSGKFNILELWLQICSDALEMLGTDLLHFNLHCPVLRVNIIELLLTGFTGIGLHLSIEILVYMDYLLHSQAQVIQCSPLVIILHCPDSPAE